MTVYHVWSGPGGCDGRPMCGTRGARMSGWHKSVGHSSVLAELAEVRGGRVCGTCLRILRASVPGASR